MARRITKRQVYWTVGVVAIIGVYAAGSADRKKKEEAAAAETKAHQTAEPEPAPPADAAPVETRTAAPPIDIRAIDLAEAYKANEVGADEKYLGKIVRVTGQVRRVGKDALDEPYVIIATALGDIQAEVAKGAGQLTRSQKIVIRCECRGLSLGTLLLKDCALE